MTELVTAFEISAGSNGVLQDALFRFGIGVASVIAGLLWLARSRRKADRARKDYAGPVILLAWGMFWLAMHIGFAEVAVLRTFDLVAIQRSGRSEIVEGIVQVGHQQPRHGHSGGDRITVGGRQFEVNYFLVTPGYRQTIAHGGVLRPGVYARLHHHDGVILKVEVRKDGK